MDTFADIWSTRLMTLSGIPVTVGSLALCVGIVLFSMILGRFARLAVVRAITKRGHSRGAAASAGKVSWYLVTFTGLFVALDTLGLNLTAVLAGSAILAVGIGFGLQNLAQNFVSGLILLIERPVKEGDFIKVGELYGEISRIGMRATHVVTVDEVTTVVPNSDLVASQVVNMSAPRSEVRIAVEVGVAYGSDVERVRAELLAIARRDPEVLDEPPPLVRFDNFGSSSLDFTLNVWIDTPSRAPVIRSDLRFAIDAAFRRAEITIAFPQRDLHIKSGLEVLAGKAS